VPGMKLHGGYDHEEKYRQHGKSSQDNRRPGHCFPGLCRPPDTIGISWAGAIVHGADRLVPALPASGHLHRQRGMNKIETEIKGGSMSIHNARRFVARLREDHNFRERALETTGPEDLILFLHEENLPCDQRELIEAMAECMAQLELQQGM